MLAVTTVHPEGYRLYGKNCLASLIKHFPGKIVAYTEAPIDLQDLKLEVRDFFAIQGASEYLEKLSKAPGADGNGQGYYDYRFDAKKFCRKVFAQDAVFNEDEHVFWFDADTVALKAMPEEFLKSLVIRPFAYLGRTGPGSYTETGFLGFNTKHEDFQKFREKYLSYFTTGKIFSQLKGWHDCIAFDHARDGIKGHNLSPGGTGIGNVIGMTVMGPYLVHLKGPRKFSDARKRAIEGAH